MKISGPKVIVPVQSEPLSIDECRTHLQAAAYGDSTLDATDDAYIEALQSAAREHCEQFLGLSLAQRMLEVELDSFPAATGAVELPFGPVLEVIAMTVGPVDAGSGSSSSDDTSIDPGAWRLDDYSQPNRLLPVGSWPVVASGQFVRVRYLAGYGVDSEGGLPLPPVARAAIQLMLGHLYANREEVADKAFTALPLGVEALLRPLRIRLGLA